ncbi:hypothetical protein M409DRAFT_62988 [Zasmidium cellare ATCC 36951]|uniref:MARVEL domain-containing protein n=1 Tax=Zasmidium cellare ATCC 36951 TaxID=1080233 RepID=A0A6A6D223_ZASCE|nr:uncharacterized protein M409DRAFT_62988 [Zasmidium cellare ATCC 36951]KAF2172232.1 hypothetical protein M409DRAFT_62988 [Zasmidium cellare ATCC 36951]
MFNPFDRRAKTAPSHYPKLMFHAVRFFQLLSSCVVGGIMCYFIWHLTHDHWSTPWTFIWLTAASLFSIAALLFTIVLHCCIGLNPRLNLVINSGLFVLWALSWSLLTWYMSGTLANMCDVEHWNEEVGVMVCRIYKALFTFTLLGLVSTIMALILDIIVHRQQTRRGVYRLHDIDGPAKRGVRPEATRGPFTDDEHAMHTRESEAWEAPRPSTGPYNEAAAPLAGGYAVPEQQFEYDTGYHGGHEGKR